MSTVTQDPPTKPRLSPRKRAQRMRWAQYLVLAIVAVVAISVADWGQIQKVFFRGDMIRETFAQGLPTAFKNTIIYTLGAFVLGLIWGTVLALMRLSSNPVMSGLAWLYIWVFRGTPLLVQIVFWGYLGLLYKQISLGVPFTDFTVFAADTNTLIPAFVAGVIALTTNQAAYSAEIVRAGMLSVDPGQKEAAYSLGMTPLFTLLKVELPQAMRVIIPPMGNETISMLKDTALLSLIAVLELYTVAERISAQNLRQVELLVVVSCWYLALTSVLSVPQYYLERHFGRGSRVLRPTPIGRVVALLRRQPKPRVADKESL